MPIHLERRDLIDIQQMEVAVRGPDGATHLILCAGIACMESLVRETYTFFVGPKLERRQFVGAIASGALSRIQALENNASIDQPGRDMDANLISIGANYDEEAGQVKVSAEISSSTTMTKLAVSYNVSILAELPIL